METIQAKIRNKLTPIINLISLLEDKDTSDSEKLNLIKRFEILTISKINCDKIIKIGEQADNLIADNLINKK